MKHLYIFFAPVLYIATINCMQKNQPPALTQQIDRYIKTETDSGNFSGTVLIAKNGAILLNKGYGNANYELNVPNTPAIKFRICSITKQFTAFAIMQLQEKGLLTVEDPLTKYIPDFPNGSTNNHPPSSNPYFGNF